MQDYNLTVLTNSGLTTFLWHLGFPIDEALYPDFFKDKIIIEINDGKNVIFEICCNCLADFSQCTCDADTEK